MYLQPTNPELMSTSLYDMILPHPLLNERIDVDYIEEVAEREGYDKFIPYTFLRHLIYAFSFYQVERNPYDCIQENNEYTKEFRRLLGMLNFEDVKTHNPLVFAFRVLKIIGKKVNLRKLDISAQTGIKLSSDAAGENNNYKFDLHELSYQQLVCLGIPDANLDTVELSPEIQKILLLYDGMELFEQPLDSEYKVVKETIRSYSDFHKTRRYRMILPTFNADLGMKKLQVTKVEERDKSASEVILAIDCSISMSQTPLSKAMIRSVILYYIGLMDKYPDLSISIVYIVGGIDTVCLISSVEDLQYAFHHIRPFTLPVKQSRSIFRELGELYSGRSIVFLTDGKLDLPVAIKLNFKLYSIVLTPNETLKQMSLVSGGQFIILE